MKTATYDLQHASKLLF